MNNSVTVQSALCSSWEEDGVAFRSSALGSLGTMPLSSSGSRAARALNSNSERTLRSPDSESRSGGLDRVSENHRSFFSTHEASTGPPNGRLLTNRCLFSFTNIINLSRIIKDEKSFSCLLGRCGILESRTVIIILGLTTHTATPISIT